MLALLCLPGPGSLDPPTPALTLLPPGEMGNMSSLTLLCPVLLLLLPHLLNPYKWVTLTLVIYTLEPAASRKVAT